MSRQMGFTPKQVERCWQHWFRPVHGNHRLAPYVRSKAHPEHYTLDAHGKLIYRHSYGKRSKVGWEMGHIRSVRAGGSNNLKRNVRPENYRDNRRHQSKHMYK
jgi:hypothetical protein